MSRKLRAPKFAVWTTQDSTTAVNSLPTSVKQLDTVIYEIEIGASVNGTLEVEASTDDENTNPKTWKALDFGTVITLNGSGSTEDLIIIRDNAFSFLRLRFTNNAGTGNITAYVSGVSKGV